MEKPSKLIYLREPELKDAHQILNWENDASLWHLSGVEQPYSLDNIKELIKSLKQGISKTSQARYLICNEEGLLLGCIDLFNYDAIKSRAGVGILIDDKYRSQSYAKMGLGLLIDYCFGTLNIHELYAHIELNNLKSIRLFEGHKFVKMEQLNEWKFSRVKPTDVALYQLINAKN